MCTFDKTCKATCQKVPVCSMECDEDEFCTLDKAGKATCSAIETFDAGALAFSGTTTSITLFPPYAFESDGDGAPFLAGAKLTVQAQGTTGAGFEKFEESFTATTFLQSKPKLDKIARTDAFGTGPLPISWAPGNDAILVTIAGEGGSVTCKAKDSSGKFEVPRSVVQAALGKPGGPYPTFTLSLARQRKETKKGFKTTGKLASATVQPEGWLDLVTTSTETATLEGCSNSDTICGDSCVDLDNDSENCGACGKTCSGALACSNGKCADACTVCHDSTKTGTCQTLWTACKKDTNCTATVACVEACTTGDCAKKCQAFLAGTTTLNFLGCVTQACQTQCTTP